MSLNQVTLMGRLTKNPEMRYASNNTIAIVSFTLAVNRRFTKEGEERQADFIFCKAFGKTAEFINSYFKKGQQVAIAGRIQTGSYEKDGQKVYTTDVIAEEVYFADSKKESGEVNNSSSNSTSGFYPVDENFDELPF